MSVCGDKVQYSLYFQTTPVAPIDIQFQKYSKVFVEFCVAASDGAVASNFPIVSTEMKNDDTWTILKMSVCSDKLSNDRNSLQISVQRVP